MEVKKHLEDSEEGVTLVEATKQTEDLQWLKYHNEKGGHGFAAEDANALNDKLKFKKVDKIGTNNKKDGADRIVNGQEIQTKYCKTAGDSVNSAFSKDSGNFRYYDRKGLPQKLEVPKDQYEQAVKIMEQKIRDGKVPGVTDPGKAKDIVKQGDITYQQAKNIAKAGNIDSLIFDLKTQSVVALYGFGISFVIQYAVCIWSGVPKKDALKISIISGLKTGSIVLGTGVITQQFFRTAKGRGFATFTANMSKRIIDSIWKTGSGKKIIQKIASVVLGKQLSGAAAKKVVIKFFRTNTAMAIITTTVTSLPDFYKALIARKISWTQFSKNLVTNVASIGGGIGGGILGSVGGAAIGGAIGVVGGPPGIAIGIEIGKVAGGFIGGVGGGVLLSLATKKIADVIAKDDAEVMFELVKEAVSELANDYMVTEEELDNAKIGDAIGDKIDNKWLQKMYQYGNSDDARKVFAYKEFEPLFEDILKHRAQIVMPEAKKCKKEVRRISLRLFFVWLRAKIFFWTKGSKYLLEEQENDVLSAKIA